MNLTKRAKTKNLIGSIKSLFVTQKQLSPRKRLPDAYFGQMLWQKQCIKRMNGWLKQTEQAVKNSLIF
jgi:hypothetical protein